MSKSSVRCSSQGFTLIELMIVVAIIGILWFILVPSYLDYLKRAKISECLIFLSAVRIRVEEHILSGGQLPTNISKEDSEIFLRTTLGAETVGKFVLGTYFRVISPDSPPFILLWSEINFDGDVYQIGYIYQTRWQCVVANIWLGVRLLEKPVPARYAPSSCTGDLILY